MWKLVSYCVHLVNTLAFAIMYWKDLSTSDSIGVLKESIYSMQHVWAFEYNFFHKRTCSQLLAVMFRVDNWFKQIHLVFTAIHWIPQCCCILMFACIHKRQLGIDNGTVQASPPDICKTPLIVWARHDSHICWSCSLLGYQVLEIHSDCLNFSLFRFFFFGF